MLSDIIMISVDNLQCSGPFQKSLVVEKTAVKSEEAAVFVWEKLSLQPLAKKRRAGTGAF